jgi:predicted AlkP superfamily phosphohydrolase/phosphomutase
MHVRSGARTGLKRRMFSAGFSPMNVYDTMMRFGLGGLKREVVRGQGQGLLKTLFLSFEDIDWRRTQAYSLGNVGQIYLNVIGREPYGCVRPGDEYERLRDEIIERLTILRDPETGDLVVETIYRREDIYHGEYLEQAPDIVFLPRNLEYFGFGEYEFGSHKIIESMRRGISGTHRMNGIFLAYGAAIRAGAGTDNACLYDLAPTILHLMGEPVPEHMDGRVLSEVIVDGDRGVARSQWKESHGTRSGVGGAELSAEDREILAERLRSLGYVG